jgi:hypothetical protein
MKLHMSSDHNDGRGKYILEEIISPAFLGYFNLYRETEGKRKINHLFLCIIYNIIGFHYIEFAMCNSKYCTVAIA